MNGLKLPLKKQVLSSRPAKETTYQAKEAIITEENNRFRTPQLSFYDQNAMKNYPAHEEPREQTMFPREGNSAVCGSECGSGCWNRHVSVHSIYSFLFI